MSLDVLKDKSQIKQARQQLVSKGVSVLESPLLSMLRKLKVIRGPKIGDKVKSWDVLSTLNFLQENVRKDEPVLDIGCFASEILVALHKLGYTQLAGVDLNPDLSKMPFNDSIEYVKANFMHTKFKDSSFRAITSISVIEHGFNSEELLREMSRLLKPEGFFIASFDYWPIKINTDGIKFFGMDWNIFSKDDVLAFLKQAENYNLFPIGEVNYEVSEKTISCAGQNYTFAWMILKKA